MTSEDQTATPLMQVILGVLTPLMLAGGITDPGLARRAAQEAIAACNPGPLIAIAQVVAFALAALDSLSLSAPSDTSITMKLRLRGNANALSRSSHRASATPPAQPTRPQANPPPVRTGTPDPPSIPGAENSSSSPRDHQDRNRLDRNRPDRNRPERNSPEQNSPERNRPDRDSPDRNSPDRQREDRQREDRQREDRHREDRHREDRHREDRQRELTWANAMTDVAAECSRNLARLAPKQRRAELIRIAALRATAGQLTRGGSSDPRARQPTVPSREPMTQRAGYQQDQSEQSDAPPAPGSTGSAEPRQPDRRAGPGLRTETAAPG
jgi:hypothetical protein